MKHTVTQNVYRSTSLPLSKEDNTPRNIQQQHIGKEKAKVFLREAASDGLQQVSLAGPALLLGSSVNLSINNNTHVLCWVSNFRTNQKMKHRGFHYNLEQNVVCYKLENITIISFAQNPEAGRQEMCSLGHREAGNGQQLPGEADEQVT